jgi:uncharacterized protein (DUF2267 family)
MAGARGLRGQLNRRASALLAPPLIMFLRIDQLASHVAAHAGVSTPLADYALRAVLAGIGGYLSPAFRQLVADELPPALATALGSALADKRPIEERVQLSGLSPMQRHELVASACKVLAEELSTEALRALRSSLPASIASMFVPSAPDVHHDSARGRQSSSVAEPNPHGDFKLSSSRGGISEPN